jgi:nucleoside-diphosphate-sugar epimerase
VALRPHLIWGPGDPHLVPRVLERCRSGRLRFVSGPPRLVDATYIDNAAQAHLDALDRLAPGAACAGRPYFIGNDEPLPMNELLGRIIRAGGLEIPTRAIGPRMAYALGMTCEGVFRLFGLRHEPPLTRFVARQLSCAHWFRLDAARRDLGYAPQVSLEEGMRRLAAWLSEGRP